MKLFLKDQSVIMDGISAEMIEAIAEAMDIWKRAGINELTITSARDGEHMPGSLHFEGHAIDLRTRSLPDVFGIADELRDRLPDAYDVVVESDHLHVEYDPKA